MVDKLWLAAAFTAVAFALFVLLYILPVVIAILLGIDLLFAYIIEVVVLVGCLLLEAVMHNQ